MNKKIFIALGVLFLIHLLMNTTGAYGVLPSAYLEHIFEGAGPIILWLWILFGLNLLPASPYKKFICIAFTLYFLIWLYAYISLIFSNGWIRPREIDIEKKNAKENCLHNYMVDTPEFKACLSASGILPVKP